MSGRAGIIASMAKALSAISPASIAVISRVPGRLLLSWKAASDMGRRCWPIGDGLATVRPFKFTGVTMNLGKTSRRALLGGIMASATGAILSRGSPAWAAIQGATDLPSIPIPPPIAAAERVGRLNKARDLMRRAGIGAVLVESGPSLDYFTGIQWWRSERLTGVVISAEGDPIIVTPFFERPSIEEMLQVPAEIRTWNEDEDPLKLVADFLRERKVAGQPVAFEETNRFWIEDRLKKQLPGAPIVSANPVVRSLRMIKSATELALMQAANDIMLASLRYAGERTRFGMTPVEIDAMIASVHKQMGSAYDGGLVLIGEATAYPHGSKQPHVVQQGDVVLLDCTSSVHGYQADISRTYVVGDPTAEQRKLWDQVHRGQQIAIQTAKVGLPAGAVDDAVRLVHESLGF